MGELIDGYEIVPIIAAGKDEIPGLVKMLEALKILYCIFIDKKSLSTLQKKNISKESIICSEYPELEDLFCDLKEKIIRESIEVARELENLISEFCESGESDILYNLVVLYPEELGSLLSDLLQKIRYCLMQESS